jgi:hypothetical protein
VTAFMGEFLLQTAVVEHGPAAAEKSTAIAYPAPRLSEAARL